MSTVKNSSYEATIEKAQYFQNVQMWPLDEKLNYKGWLNNFKTGKERDLACLILEFFMYYPDPMLDHLLRTSVGKAGVSLSKKFKDWKHGDFKNRCIYSFIPGESPNPTDSGPIFTRKLREALGIPESQIKFYHQLGEILDNMSQPTPVILVDDFVGSGAQCNKAWNTNKFDTNGLTLKQVAEKQGHVFVYAPLIVNEKGFNRLSLSCEDLILSPAHILGEVYNLFNPSCICWKGDIGLFKNGTELILRKSTELGIPSTKGKSTLDEKGFGMQGLALSFENGPPDAVPAFFYWCHDQWTPLVQKNYER